MRFTNYKGIYNKVLTDTQENKDLALWDVIALLNEQDSKLKKYNLAVKWLDRIKSFSSYENLDASGMVRKALEELGEIL